MPEMRYDIEWPDGVQRILLLALIGHQGLFSGKSDLRLGRFSATQPHRL